MSKINNDKLDPVLDFINSAERRDYIASLEDPESPNYNPWMAMEAKECDVQEKAIALYHSGSDKSPQAYASIFNNTLAGYFDGDELKSRQVQTDEEYYRDMVEYYNYQKNGPSFLR